ncbi:hypothetical protein JQ544_25595 [Bradyrhizobium diazoefficiens]|nr:hypothetical protein [Bradyrhizobium diazoefficiens]MBR0814929.1 hypothetical protein [Bradyrhizobium diazoefficiens]
MAAAFAIAAGASFSEIHRLKGRIGELTRHEFRDHRDVRQLVIAAAVADATDPIVVLGDSITEMAPLPREICGHPVVNAGIGGQTIQEAQRLATRILGERSAYLVALSVGANDVGSTTVQKDFGALIDAVRTLSALTPVAVSVTSDAPTNRGIAAAATARGVRFVAPEIPAGSMMTDNIHYLSSGYRVWVPALEAAIVKECSAS